LSGTAWVDRKILAAMIAESNYWCPKETGGVLMGYWSDRDVVITDIIGPGSKAIHRRYSFTPDALWQQHEIARIYEKTGRVHTYLGDWHSHPYGGRDLSVKDLEVMIRVATHEPARAVRPIFGIVYNNPKWELVIWRFAFSNIDSGAPAVVMKLFGFDSYQ